MSHTPTSNTLRTQVNFLLALLTSQYFLTRAIVHKKANTCTIGSQHLVPSSHQLAAHIMLSTSTLELQCKDQVTKVTRVVYRCSLNRSAALSLLIMLVFNNNLLTVPLLILNLI